MRPRLPLLSVRLACLLGLAVSLAGTLAARPAAAADMDVGNLAVLETDPTILQPGELFDLNAKTLTFTPKGGGGYNVNVGALVFDAQVGANLQLGDDDTASRPLGFNFPFFGVTRTSVFINSNGNLTFGSASTLAHFNPGGTVGSLGTDLSRALDRIAASGPRIAVLWQDWDPSAGGGVFAKSLADRMVVTWSGVPLFGTATTATFQVTLFNTGVIQMSYQSVTSTPGGGYLVGISPSGVNQFLVTTLDFSLGPAASISTFANFEPLVQTFGSSASPLVHISAVARRFFKTHPDSFDQLVLFANFQNALGNAFAFEFTVHQTIAGIGLGIFDISSFFGGPARLQSFLNMNRLSLYPTNPNQPFLGTNTTLDLLGQEAGHMWLAFPRFDDGGTCSDLLLGRDLAHWSFFHDSDASDMEGNNWQDNGNGTFTSFESTARFSALDQYIQGLRTAGEVANFFFIRNPSAASCPVLDPSTGERSCPPQIGVTVAGTRQNVSIDQIKTCEGARWPASGFTAINQTNTFKQAFILLVPAGVPAPAADLTKLETFRAPWVPYFNAGTSGRGNVDTTLAAAPPPVFTGGVFVAAANILGTGAAEIVTGPGPGGGPHVKAFGADNSDAGVNLMAYVQAFTGGVRVAACNNLDGTSIIVTGAGPGGGPHVRVVDGATLTELASFFPYPAGFTGGVFVACGDLDGDGKADIVTGAGQGGGPHVRMFKLAAGPGGVQALTGGFFPYAIAFAGGVRVALCDVNGDGKADIVTAAGPGGGPHVRVLDGGKLIVNAADPTADLGGFFAYGGTFTGGVFVACGNVLAAGTPQIVTGADAGGGPHVMVFLPNGSPMGGGFFAYDSGFIGGVRVAVGNLDAAGLAEIITAPGPGGGPHVRGFTGMGVPTATSFFAY